LMYAKFTYSTEDQGTIEEQIGTGTNFPRSDLFCLSQVFLFKFNHLKIQLRTKRLYRSLTHSSRTDRKKDARLRAFDPVASSVRESIFFTPPLDGMMRARRPTSLRGARAGDSGAHAARRRNLALKNEASSQSRVAAHPRGESTRAPSECALRPRAHSPSAACGGIIGSPRRDGVRRDFTAASGGLG
jgi:hypothetical protein